MLGLVFPFIGCDKESNVEQPTEIMLSVAPLTLEFEAEAESKTVKIATDGDRWIFLDGYPSWIDVVEDGDVLTVTVEKNETGATRSGLIDIKAIRGSDSRTKSIVVRQYAEDDAPDDGYVHFGDDAFEELILGYYDANGDGVCRSTRRSESRNSTSPTRASSRCAEWSGSRNSSNSNASTMRLHRSMSAGLRSCSI